MNALTKIIQSRGSFKMSAVFISFALVALHCQVLLADDHLEGIWWRVIEIAGSAVTPTVGNRPPGIKLDAKLHQATGYNGCNYFFGEYELQANNLTFGQLGNTQRACAAKENSFELKFMEVLEKTRAWKIKDGILSLLNEDRVLARFKVHKANDAELDIPSFAIHSLVHLEVPVTFKGVYHG